MATIKLNKNKPASDKPSTGPRRAPVRGGGGVGKPRPTLAQAQADRAERQAAYEQRRAEEEQGQRRPGGPARGPGAGRYEGRGNEGRGGDRGQQGYGPRGDSRDRYAGDARGSRYGADDRGPRDGDDRGGRFGHEGRGSRYGQDDRGPRYGQDPRGPGPRDDRAQRADRPMRDATSENRYAREDRYTREDGAGRGDRFDPRGSGRYGDAPRGDDRPRQARSMSDSRGSGGRYGNDHVPDRSSNRDLPRGTDRGAGRGDDRGYDRGFDRGADRGGDRGFDRGADRGFDRGADRGFDRPDRGPARDAGRGPAPYGDRYIDRPRTDRPPRATPPGQERPPAPRRQADPSEGERLSKRMSELGLASRREADEWIEAGWVTVDGKIAELGQRVGPDVKIEVDPAARVQQAQRVTILLHKPIGYVSGQAEDGYENAAVLIKADTHWSEDPAAIAWAPGHARGLAPAGRLDIDSTGLLVLTQDGRVARHLIGEDSNVEKEYLVRVAVEQGNPDVPPQHQLDPRAIALLNHGLELDEVALKPAKVSWANEDQLRFVLREGRKRQIRRMCELVGLKVLALKRVRIGRIPLGHLPAGQWRYLAPWERF